VPPHTKQNRQPGDAAYSCPDCIGVLRVEINEKGRKGYVCQVGHRFSTRSLLVAKEKDLEKALWSAAVLLLHKVTACEELLHQQRWSGEIEKGLRRRIREATRQYHTLVRMIEHTHGTQ
jgi:two-component system chemotaxis response regulator CheB